MQYWHLYAPREIGITHLLIRFLRSKNTDGIPPQNTAVGTDVPLSPVPGGRGFFSVQGDVELPLEIANRSRRQKCTDICTPSITLKSVDHWNDIGEAKKVLFA